MNPIVIVIPTLDPEQARETGYQALQTSGCEARIIIAHDEKKQGFTKNVNNGIRQASEREDVCLLNDDVWWFPHGWLATLGRALHSHRKYGAVCPSGKSSTAPMRDGILGQWGLRQVNHIPFWCVLLKREMIDQQGLLDEHFIHYASDNLYCDKALIAGWDLVWCRDVYLGHQQHGSGLIETWKIHDSELYRQKSLRWHHKIKQRERKNRVQGL